MNKDAAKDFAFKWNGHGDEERDYQIFWLTMLRDVFDVAKPEEIILKGIKPKDAYHLASALLAECDYFLSTDDRLLKYKTNEIILLNPVDFIKILEANQYDTSG